MKHRIDATINGGKPGFVLYLSDDDFRMLTDFFTITDQPEITLRLMQLGLTVLRLSHAAKESQILELIK